MPRSLPFPKGRRRNRDASNDPDGENRILQSLSLNDPVLLQPQLKLIDLKRGPVRQAAVAQRPSGSTFGNLTDKLTMFRVTCTKCGRFGRYPISRLIKQRGRDLRIIDWLDELAADCPTKLPRALVTNATRGAPACRR